MPIDSQHPQYAQNAGDWKKIEDITRLKNLHSYLLRLNEHDTSVENRDRNEKYRERAIFYALTSQTVSGMVGTVFRKWPVLDVPSSLDYLKSNADGSGNSIYQQSQGLLDDLVRKSRAGLVVSFPPMEREASRADIQSGRAVATIQRLEPEQVINWRTTTEGSQTKLSLVVIHEQREETGSDGYSVEYVEQIREMFLEDGVYRERHWTKGKQGWTHGPVLTPLDSRGSPWNEIPFTFVGAENNDPSVDQANMLGMVELNIGHYRNSADYEDSVWYAGQAQPWMSGVDQNHIDLMKENKMYVGSRMLLAVPEGQQFGFAQADPNPHVRQAMLDKVDLMIGLGARMIQPGSAVKTATQAAGEREVQHSVLSLIASNVSEAYTRCLGWVGRYMGVEGEMAYTLNQDYVDPEVSPQELQVMMTGFIQGSVPLPDYVRYMQKRSIFDEEKSAEDYAEDLMAPPLMRAGDAIDSESVD